MFTNLYPFSPLNSRDSRLCWWASFGVDLSQNLYWQRNRHKKLSMNACREIREVNCCSLLTSFLYISPSVTHTLSLSLSLFPLSPARICSLYTRRPLPEQRNRTPGSLSLCHTHTLTLPRSCSSYTRRKQGGNSLPRNVCICELIIEVLSLSPHSLTHFGYATLMSCKNSETEHVLSVVPFYRYWSRIFFITSGSSMALELMPVFTVTSMCEHPINVM